MPWVNKRPVRHVREGVNVGYPADGLFVEAYWCNNYYVRSEDIARNTETWAADSLPPSPLHQVIEAAWRSTQASVSVDTFKSQLSDQNY